jgi:transitional endoplasmic reticulum ATPase
MSRLLARTELLLATSAAVEPVVVLWTLRFLVDLELHRQFVQPNGWASDMIAHALGLPSIFRARFAVGHACVANTLLDDADDLPDPDDLDFEDDARPAFDPIAAVQLLRERLARAEVTIDETRMPDVLAANMEQLRRLVGLSDTEMRILAFSVLVHADRMLDLMSDWTGDLTTVRLSHVLAAVLDIDEAEVRMALSPQGTLARSGLMAVDRRHRYVLSAKLDMLSDSFCDLMVSDITDPAELLRGMVMPAPPAGLAPDDFAHIEQPYALMQSYLASAVRKRRRGVNVLVHGEPGTGKTELTRVLAHALHFALYEIASEDSDGDAVLGEDRLRAFRAAQAFFAARAALLVFDEAEDIFADAGPRERSVAQVRKAWLNRALEDNPVPTLWLSNSVVGLDPAFVRRFDMVLPMPVPPVCRREQIVRAACGKQLSDRLAQRMSKHAALTPGVVSRAAGVLHEVAGAWPAQRFNDTLELLVNNTLRAQGHAVLSHGKAELSTGAFKLAYINADCDLESLARGIVRTRSARLCLYGPPGTGKTAFGEWLAQQTERPLMQRRASDLLSPFLGETERNMARVFDEATRERALLCIDEADSFLRDRSRMQRGWEVTQINEMLTQIEHFEGILVMSTNLLDTLDEAALRRFDAKVRFAHLTAAQRAALFAQHCCTLGFDTPDSACEWALARLDALTPGDFAAVLRRHGLSPLATPEAFVAALASECNLKRRGAASIGFV